MHPTQKAYAVAKTIVELAYERRTRLLAPYRYLLEDPTDKDIERHTDLMMVADGMNDVQAKMTALRKAESEMVCWAKSHIERHALYNQEVETLLEKVIDRRYVPRKYREEIISMAYRLEV